MIPTWSGLNFCSSCGALYSVTGPDRGTCTTCEERTRALVYADAHSRVGLVLQLTRAVDFLEWRLNLSTAPNP